MAYRPLGGLLYANMVKKCHKQGGFSAIYFNTPNMFHTGEYSMYLHRYELEFGIIFDGQVTLNRHFI